MSIHARYIMKDLLSGRDPRPPLGSICWEDAWYVAAQWCYDVSGLPSSQEIEEYQWDGTALRSSTASGLLHELAHVVVASDDRKWVPGFGLGAEPESGWKTLDTGLQAARKRNVEMSAIFSEEGDASMLGILFERYLYMDYRSTLIEHHWVYGTRSGCPKGWVEPRPGEPFGTEETIDRLILRGLCDKEGFPIIQAIERESRRAYV